MKLFLKIIFLFCFIAFSQQLKCQTTNEVAIFNSLIDSLYDMNTCVKIINPPYYKCCDQDTLYGEKLVECCNQSNIPVKYRVYCSNCINKGELDSLNLLMVVNDSLSTLDISEGRKYLLSKISKGSKFYDFVRNIRKPLKSQPYSVDSLKQGRIKFLTIEKFNDEGYIHRFGKINSQLLLGYFDLSRIYFDKTNQLGIFKMDWVGGGTCGYNKYILIRKENGTWKIEKKILWGIY